MAPECLHDFQVYFVEHGGGRFLGYRHRRPPGAGWGNYYTYHALNYEPTMPARVTHPRFADLLSTSANGSQPTTERDQPPWYYKVDRFTFLPIKQKADWTNEQDVREYEDRFGKSDDRLGDTRIRLNQNVAKLHRVLASGINYFLQKRVS
jgi:hypothetical protein